MSAALSPAPSAGLSSVLPGADGLPEAFRNGTDRVRTGLGGTMALALAASLLLLAALTAWAALTPISGAVIVGGQTVLQGQPRDLQHLDGGIVTAIHARNGDLVTEGQVLMALDPTLLQVNLDIARSRLAEALAKRARLMAEQSGTGPVTAALLQTAPEALHLGGQDLSAPLAGQMRIMAARAEVLAGMRDSLAERTAQFDAQAAGLEALVASQEEQIGYTDRDIANMESLAAKGLVRDSALSEARRNRADLLGDLASYRSERAGIANAVRDAEITVAQAERQFREQVVTDLGGVTAEIGELVLQIVTTAKQLDRVEMRAPVTGIVHEMKVTTVGGVVPAGQTVAQIVPTGEGMEFEMQLPAQSVDSAHPGQTARLRLVGPDPRRTPELRGEVVRISPAAIADDRSGQSFYRLRVTVPAAELARLEGEPLVPGMPVEGYLETGMRPVLDWLVQPLWAHVNRAFREG